jgi:hypothetical protein
MHVFDFIGCQGSDGWLYRCVVTAVGTQPRQAHEGGTEFQGLMSSAAEQ